MHPCMCKNNSVLLTLIMLLNYELLKGNLFCKKTIDLSFVCVTAVMSTALTFNSLFWMEF